MAVLRQFILPCDWGKGDINGIDHMNRTASFLNVEHTMFSTMEISMEIGCSQHLQTKLAVFFAFSFSVFPSLSVPSGNQTCQWKIPHE